MSKNEKVLFVSTQPKEALTLLGQPQHVEWFREGLGFPKDTDLIRSVDAIGEVLPFEIDERGIIIGGSVNSVYEDLAWIRRLEDFVEKMSEQGKSILGVCFGHQLVAKANGFEVEKTNGAIEIGLIEIHLNEEGRNDPLFKDVGTSFKIGTAHSDIIASVPDASDFKILARSKYYDFQSLADGNVRTVQFHPELTPEFLLKIVNKRKDKIVNSGFVDGEEGFSRLLYEIENSNIAETGQRVLQNWYKYYVLR